MRKQLFSVFLRVCFVLFSAAVAAENLPIVDVYKNQQCGCCNGWIDHLRKNGFTVQLHDVNYVQAINTKFGISNQYASCHTAKVGDYYIVGHVPAADIKRLLNERPEVLGLAVPGMPAGSPGMESESPVHYDSLLLKKNGEATVFQHH